MDDAYEAVDDASGDDGAFESEYESSSTTHHTDSLLMISVLAFTGVVLCVVLPMAIAISKQMKKVSVLEEEKEEKAGTVPTSVYNIVRFDSQTVRLLVCTIPFTASSLFVATCECAILCLVSHFARTAEVIAYAEVLMLLHLVQELLKGPIYANPSICARSIGEGNSFLAGQYVQLSVTLYLIFALPFALFWSFNMYEVVTFFGWGDSVVGQYAQDFTRMYVWSTIIDAIAEACMYLLEVTDHEIFATFVRLSHVVTNVICLLVLIFATQMGLTLHIVGLVLLTTSVSFFLGLLAITHYKGWLSPFLEGLTKALAIRNIKAVKNILHVAVPLSIGSVVANAEWTILTAFVASMGEAKVGAWVILGHIWHLFDAATYGAGDAAEMQVALQLSLGRPDLAKLAAYKSLLLGMLGAAVVYSVFALLMPSVPALFTPNAVLQEIIGDALPFIGIAYLALAYCYLCWYIVGGTGKYGLANCIHFLVSLLVTLPAAGILTYVLQFDLQGPCAAIAIGYVTVAGALSFVFFTIDWDSAGQDEAEKYDDSTNGSIGDEFSIESEDDFNAEIMKKKRVTFAQRDEILDFKPSRQETMTNVATLKSRRAKAVASRNILLILVKPGPLGITIASPERSLVGTVVTSVDSTSPLFKRVVPGDRIVAIDGFSVAKAPAPLVSKILQYSEGYKQREIAVLTSRKRVLAEDLGSSCTVCACYEDDFDDGIDAEIEMDYVRYGQVV